MDRVITRFAFLISLTAFLSVLLSLSAPVHAAWRSYKYEQMTLVTDLPENSARKLLQQLDWFDRVVDHYTVMRDHSAPPLRVLLFDDREEYEKIFQQRHFAAFTQPALSRTTLVVGPSDRSQALQNTLHEYVHYRLRTQSQSYPMWYEEGLATILSTTRFVQHDNEVNATTTHQLPPKFANAPLPRVALAELTSTSNIDLWPHRKVGGFYKRSAQLTRFLLFAQHISHPELTSGLHKHLASRNENLFAALHQSPDQLEELLQQFNQSRNKPTYEASWQPQLIEPTVTHLSTREVSLILAQTAVVSNPKYAARRYQRLLRSTPNDAELWAALAAAQRDLAPQKSRDSLARAQQLDATHPEVMLQTALQDLAACPLDRSLTCISDWQRVTLTLREVLEKNPNHHQAILWLGVTELYSGNPGGARNYLTIAYQRAPWAPRVNYLLGEALRLLGNPRARVYLTRAKLWAYDEKLRDFATASLALMPRVSVGTSATQQ